MRVLVIHECTARGEIIRDTVERAGHEVTQELAADLIVIDTGSPGRETLAHLAAMTRHTPRPVVMLAADGARETIRQAMRAGVCAYAVGDLDAGRMQTIIDGAVARFEERRLIDRAKAVLMQMRGLDEEAAYAFMRKAAMDRKTKLASLARGLLEAAGVLSA